jgi:preprotein translocase subunit SecA
MYDIRRTLCDYTNFIEEQRKYFLGKRQKVLHENIHLQTNPIDPHENAEMIITSPNIKKFILNQYDLAWAKHLNFASELREGIHLVRLGGENPVRVFQKKTYEHFNQVQSEMESTITNFIAQNPDGKDVNIKRPSSTWTYTVNDNPFGNRLSMALLNNSNIGFQTDPFSLGILLIIGFVKRVFPKKKKKNRNL